MAARVKHSTPPKDQKLAQANAGSLNVDGTAIGGIAKNTLLSLILFAFLFEHLTQFLFFDVRQIEGVWFWWAFFVLSVAAMGLFPADSLFSKVDSKGGPVLPRLFTLAYEKIGSEMEAGQKDQGTWTRALGTCKGNHQKAEAYYYDLRLNAFTEQSERASRMLRNFLLIGWGLTPIVMILIALCFAYVEQRFHVAIIGFFLKFRILEAAYSTCPQS